jgi:hypothetical protein
MRGTTGKQVAVFVVFLVVVAGGVFLALYLMRTPHEPGSLPRAGSAAPPPPAVESPMDAGTPGEVSPPSVPAAGEPTDEQIREWAAALSSNAELARWAQNQYLLGKFVATVEIIARGESPRQLLPFMAPEGRFETLRRGEDEFLDPQSYHRYDGVATAFASLDAQVCARLIERLYPWLNRKYREIGEPGVEFRTTLAGAIAELLRVPVVEGDVPLHTRAVAMRISIPEFEAMSQAQKHLFRMGPDNIRKIQAKLREIGRALGLSRELDAVVPLALPPREQPASP